MQPYHEYLISLHAFMSSQTFAMKIAFTILVYNELEPTARINFKKLNFVFRYFSGLLEPFSTIFPHFVNAK